jgi:hypothetical protein
MTKTENIHETDGGSVTEALPNFENRLRDIQIDRLLEAIRAAAYYIERLERVMERKRVRDMCEAMEHYRRVAIPLIAAYDKEEA